jgi:hypothetical protein
MTNGVRGVMGKTEFHENMITTTKHLTPEMVRKLKAEWFKLHTGEYRKYTPIVPVGLLARFFSR